MTTEHNPLTCQYCHPLPCEDYHDAAANIHAYLRSLVNRNWAKDMAKAKAEAKKLHKTHKDDPDYRFAPNRRLLKPQDPAANGRKGGLAVQEANRIERPILITKEQLGEKRFRPSRAAYMRQYRKMQTGNKVSSTGL